LALILPARARALLLLSVAVLAACADSPPASNAGGQPAPDTTGPDPTEAVTSPTFAATPTGAAAPTANLADGCVESFDPAADYFPEQLTFEHAVGVSVTYESNYKVVEVVPPAAPDTEPLRYVLVQCGTPAPEASGELAAAQVIEVPVADVATLTTTNLPHFDVIDRVDALAAVANPEFVSTPSVREGLDSGTIESAGSGPEPDLELLIALAPDLLLLDAFGDAVLDDVGRFVEGGVPTAVNADFNETTLLGRAEWLKYTALFLNAEAAATAAFDEIAGDYTAVAEQAAGAEERPTVLVNTPFEGTWYVPGGGSYLATAIAEAGGEYVFGDDDSTGALELDIETVLDRAAGADSWLQAGSVHGSLSDLLAQDPRFAEFEAFADGQVWAYDKSTTPEGGNAVFELAYTRADLYLSDLVKILHPDLLGDHELVFFGRVPPAPDATAATPAPTATASG
jgi:iron complex transport system substrate-binding protein